MKEKLASCVTQQDSYEVFSDTDSLELHKFVRRLEAVKEYINITMRDEFLLEQAKGILINRGFKNI